LEHFKRASVRYPIRSVFMTLYFIRAGYPHSGVFLQLVTCGQCNILHRTGYWNIVGDVWEMDNILAAKMLVRYRWDKAFEGLFLRTRSTMLSAIDCVGSWGLGGRKERRKKAFGSGSGSGCIFSICSGPSPANLWRTTFGEVGWWDVRPLFWVHTRIWLIIEPKYIRFSSITTQALGYSILLKPRTPKPSLLGHTLACLWRRVKSDKWLRFYNIRPVGYNLGHSVPAFRNMHSQHPKFTTARAIT